jgi:hypothetical protein
MHRPQRFLGFAEVAQLAPVGSLPDGERTRVHVEAAPPQRKQFARTKRLGHVQRQQDAIPERYRCQYEPQLTPAQSSPVHRPEMLWQDQLACRIFLDEILLDGLLEDRLQVSLLTTAI